MSEHEGERELVLGNKQLLGIFFVATLLCGVFFAMGYVVGGNSAKPAPPAASESDAASSSDGKREQPSAPSEATAAARGDAGSSVPPAEPMMTYTPVAAGSQPPSQVPPQPAPQDTSSPTARTPMSPPPQPLSAAPAPKQPSANGVGLSVMEAGATYWQVTAVERPAAEKLVKSLREQMPAILSESSRPGEFRVLVGPYHSAAALADAKIKLRTLGFDSPFIQRQ